MKKIKVNVLLLLILMFIFLLDSVSAISNEYYENENGVIVSEKEYQYINEVYGDSYFDNMTTEDYEWVSELNIDENEIEIITIYDNDVSLLSTSHTTTSKKLTIASSCSISSCKITTICTWLTNPKIRSYDVMGARLSGVSLIDASVITKITSSSGTSFSTYINESNNGFGVSVKLPTSATNISITQQYEITRGGTVYASYQHATSSISLATSQLYTISSSGAGGVFKFSGAATNAFDNMGGVSISI